MRIITKTALLIGIGYGLYFVACNHFIYFGAGNIKLLKKKEPTFSSTFFSATLKSNKIMLEDDVLRKAGLPELLIKMGRMSERERKLIMKRYHKKEDIYDE